LRHLAIIALVAGCSPTTSDPGLAANLRVSPTKATTAVQYFPGAMPGEQNGPPVNSIGANSSSVRAGRGTTVTGLVPRNRATAVAFGLAGDAGYWIVQPNVPDLTVPSQLVIDARLDFSPLTPPGMVSVIARAVDSDDNFGPPTPLALKVEALPIPDGKMVISLLWNNQADLDLHVQQPDGIEIWAGNINAYKPPPPGQLPDPLAPGAVLNFDSNKQCANDGRDQEDVVYGVNAPMPAGHYVARVDSFSLCGEIGAAWAVEVRIGGELKHRASGTAREIDTAMAHGEGGGLLAVEFDVP
jgi:hypothetical protein